MSNAPVIVDLPSTSLGLRDSSLSVLPPRGSGPPLDRPEGYTVGMYTMERPPPHRGEMHPDGDELVVLLSGEAILVHEATGEGNEERVVLHAGKAVIMPRGVWHRFEFDAPVTMLTATPGPNAAHRPIDGSGTVVGRHP